MSITENDKVNFLQCLLNYRYLRQETLPGFTEKSKNCSYKKILGILGKRKLSPKHFF